MRGREESLKEGIKIGYAGNYRILKSLTKSYTISQTCYWEKCRKC